METKNKSAFMAVHPGAVLREELNERNLSQKEFAEQIGMRPSHLSELLNGKRGMTMAIADKLQVALNIPSQVWMNLQMQYTYDSKSAQESAGLTLQVSINDPSLLNEIKRAISLLKGVGRVAVL